MDKPLIRITEVAAIMGISQTTLAAGLIQQLYPFGNATKGKRSSYRYIIIRSRFEKYMAGADMAQYSDNAKNSRTDNETLISVVEAAKIMGISTITLIRGLRQNLYPFGNAIRTNENDSNYSHWRYIITKRRFELFMSAGDIKAPAGWEQIQHYAVFRSKDNPSEPPMILCLYEFHLSEYDDAYFKKRFEESFKKTQLDYAELENEKEIIKEMNLSEGRKLRRYCEDSNLYYSTEDIYKILAPCPDAPLYCKLGIYKGINPDGRKWFIEKEAFNNMDPEQLPKKCRNRFKRYLIRISNADIK